MSGISGELIEKFGGSFLKSISIPIEIGPIQFSISLFVIATFIVKNLLFSNVN